MAQSKNVYFVLLHMRKHLNSSLFPWKANLVPKVTRGGAKGVKETRVALLTKRDCLETGQSMVKELVQACLMK